MSPLKIEILLRIKVFRNPFDGYTLGQKHSNAMRDAFLYFRAHGIIQPWLRVDHTWETDDANEPRLTEKGLDLVRRLQEIEP